MTTAPATNQFITTEVHGRVGIITHCQPERMNVWSPEIGDEIRRALHAFDVDPSIGAIVWTGTGRAFCAGGDVK